jgi:hypothetical protein
MPASRFLEGLDAAPTLLVGSGVERYLEVVERLVPDSTLAQPLDQPPPVEHLAAVGHRLSPLPDERVRMLEPDYIRSSEAELKRLRETRP